MHELNAHQPGRDEIIAYYDEMRAAYRLAWGTERNLSIHYGYHDLKHRRHDQALINMNRVLADLAAIGSGQKVLDAGCGVGGSSIWLAEQRGAQVTGININAGQLALARDFARRRGVSDRVTFEERDYSATGLGDASFDVVWGLESICYAAQKEAFVAEAARLLTTGGRLIVADGFRTGKTLDRRQEALMNNWIRGWAAPDLASVVEFRGYLEAHGFGAVEFVDISRQVMPSARRIYRTSLLTAPATRLLHALGLRSRIQRDASVASRCQYPALREGLWVYGVFTATR